MSRHNKEAHTGGPWVQADSNPLLVFQDSQGVINTNKPVAQFKYAKDARLTTCVHDLLSALQDFVNGVETGAITSDHDETLHNAMIKATAAIKAAREGK